MYRLSIRLIFFLIAVICSSHAVRGQAAPAFAPLEQWRVAVLNGDASALTQLYSTSPVPQIKTPATEKAAIQDEVNFWTSWKIKGLSGLHIEIAQNQTPQPDVHVVILQLTLAIKENGVTKNSYLAMAQGWVRQGDTWRIAFVQRQDAARLRQPLEQKDLYPASANAKAEIAEILHKVNTTHQRVLLVFGANWCYDCHVLDEAFHSPEIAPTMEKSFEVVHVDIGQADKNLDLAKQYDVPLDRGVPAIAVLDSDGKLLFSQKRGEFEAARSMAPEDILDFLNKWKPATAKN